MCAIIGALVTGLTTSEHLLRANSLLNFIFRTSHERGRDGRGYLINDGKTVSYRDIRRAEGFDWEDVEFFSAPTLTATLIGNLRAEPTTEYVLEKSVVDQQPYQCEDWSIVHNGTIANDKQLRHGQLRTKIDSAAIVEDLQYRGKEGCTPFPFEVRIHFEETVKRLEGSYAILANHRAHPGMIMVAANYRPIWYVKTEFGVFFASARHYFPADLCPQMLEPYSTSSFYSNAFQRGGEIEILSATLRERKVRNKALVVCSGGLDSVVSAAWAVRAGYEVTLLHFRYGSRAETREVSALWKVAASLGVGMAIHYLNAYSPDDSPLLRADSEIAGGEEGAEFAHEWVPARNLVMLATAAAIAEARGFDTLVLGNNLEEAGAYPDNEPEFIDKFNDLLPFAIGNKKQLKVIMPVGNLMKHEIVALGHELEAPMDKTWSCYRAGKLHCGRCGPCYMRRKAFEINKLPEVITYEDET